MSLSLSHITLLQALFHGQVSSAEIQHWLDQVEHLLTLQQDFFFLAQTAPASQFSADYRALQARWYKTHKPAFRRHCLGLVRIACDAQDLARLDTPALHAAWQVPYYVTLSRQQGLQWIGQQWGNTHA